MVAAILLLNGSSGPAITTTLHFHEIGENLIATKSMQRKLFALKLGLVDYIHEI